MDAITPNYARIMSVLREMGHAGAVGPHCVPSSLQPLPLLSYDQSGNVLMKLYDDMVVKDCSCPWPFLVLKRKQYNDPV